MHLTRCILTPSASIVAFSGGLRSWTWQQEKEDSKCFLCCVLYLVIKGLTFWELYVCLWLPTVFVWLFCAQDGSKVHSGAPGGKGG